MNPKTSVRRKPFELLEAQQNTLGEWLQAWYVKDKACYVQPATAEMYWYMIKLIARYPIWRANPKEISGDQVELLLNTLYRDGYSKSSIVKVKSLLHQAFAASEIQSPTTDCRIPAAHQKLVYSLTEDEQTRLLEELRRDRLGNVYIFMLHTGLRRSELIALQWQDCDLQKKLIYVRKSKTKAGVRTIPLVPTAWQILTTQPHINSFVFNNNGQPLTPGAMKHLYERLRKKTGIDHLTNHVLRHTFATNLYEKDCPVKAITLLLGHADEKSTAPYLTPTATYLMQQIFRLEK